MSHKVELREVLAAFDLNQQAIWDELTPEQKKSVSFFTINRWLSLVSGSREMQELAVLQTNEYLNKHFFDIKTSGEDNHNKLQWLSCCISANYGDIMKHNWLYPKKVKKVKNVDTIKKYYPNLNDDEATILAKITTAAELKALVRDHGEN